LSAAARSAGCVDHIWSLRCSAEKIAFFMRTPAWCRHRASELGPRVSELIAALLAGGALHHLRAAQGVLGLAERYGPERLDAACARALQVGDPSYRTVKGILVVGAETVPAQDISAHSASVATPAHLHGPNTLFAHLDDGDGDGDGDRAGDERGAVGA
jgi:hypothetical protein